LSQDFSVTYFLPTVPWLWGRLCLVKMSTRNIPGVKGGRCVRMTNLHVPNVMKSGSLNLLEPSGPHHACYGKSLLLYFTSFQSLPQNPSFQATHLRLSATYYSIFSQLLSSFPLSLSHSYPRTTRKFSQVLFKYTVPMSDRVEV
jgi:hypothetical protein